MGRGKLAIKTKFFDVLYLSVFFFPTSWRKCSPSVALGRAEFSLTRYGMINVTGHLFLLLILQKIPLLIALVVSLKEWLRL